MFQDYGWITALNLIKKAAVPVIKMSVDTSIPFICPHYYYYLPTLNREHNAGPIEIDLTIESYTGNECNHLGLISTAAINQWLAEIATLHTIIIIMKQYFVNRKLNVTYEGGLKTYAMIVMIVAYIRHADLQLEENPAKVLRRLAEFYEKFDEAKQGINIDSKPVSQIFYMKETKSNEGMNKSCEVKNKSKADLEIHDPMNHGKIMTQSCYSFPEIKQLFKDIINLCYHSTDNELLGLFTSFDWQVCRCDIGESKKCF